MSIKLYSRYLKVCSAHNSSGVIHVILTSHHHLKESTNHCYSQPLDLYQWKLQMTIDEFIECAGSADQLLAVQEMRIR